MIISVIIPALNAAHTLPRVLASIQDGPALQVEIIVVDDGSKDRTAEIAEKRGCKVIQMGGTYGPSRARNTGAKAASGDLFVFTDADIVFMDDTLTKIVNTFEQHEICAAVVGNLTPRGHFENAWSTYKNLYTHFSLKNSGAYPTSVFTSLTAVWPLAFWDVGGFPDIYPNEDRLFGMALAQKRYRILFDNSLQVQHLHNYSWDEFLRMEFQRARNIFLLTLEMKLLKQGMMEEHIPRSFWLASVGVGGAILFIVLALFLNRWILLLSVLR